MDGREFGMDEVFQSGTSVKGKAEDERVGKRVHAYFSLMA